MKFMEKIRVMLAEDNQSILRLLSDFLSGKPEIELVAAEAVPALGFFDIWKQMLGTVCMAG